MLDNVLSDNYRKLQPRYRRYRRYSKLTFWTGMSTILSLFVVAMVLMIVDYVYNITIGFLEANVLILTLLGVGTLIAYLFGRRVNVYRLTVDELTLFHSCSALESIQNHLEASTSALKKEYRKNAVKSAKQLLSIAETYWNIGSFKLAKTIFGDVISKMKDNFRNRLIPNLEEGDEPIIREVENIIYSFAHHSRNPSIKDFEHLNKMMLDRLSRYEPKKSRLQELDFSMLFGQAVLKHVLVTSIIGLVSYIVFLIGVSVVQISEESSFIASTALFGVLLAGYWQRSR